MVHGDRLAPIVVLINCDVPTRELVALSRRALVNHRRHHARNDNGRPAAKLGSAS